MLIEILLPSFSHLTSVRIVAPILISAHFRKLQLLGLCQLTLVTANTLCSQVNGRYIAIHFHFGLVIESSHSTQKAVKEKKIQRSINSLSIAQHPKRAGGARFPVWHGTSDKNSIDHKESSLSPNNGEIVVLFYFVLDDRQATTVRPTHIWSSLRRSSQGAFLIGGVILAPFSSSLGRQSILFQRHQVDWRRRLFRLAKSLFDIENSQSQGRCISLKTVVVGLPTSFRNKNFSTLSCVC